ncbi:MAG TPA: ribonuclease PH [Anaerolineales bacterium]|nr:ribonuclease PH [Anaerolineales bacterium]
MAGSMVRADGRKADEIRGVRMMRDFVPYAEGSVLIEMGETKVLCNATIQRGAPRWMDQQGVIGGWVTAEYALLPRSTQIRTARETDGLRGRTQEIRRLIGRSLRAGVALEKLGSRTVIVDCDVLQADGGTRAASVCGGYVALALALRRLVQAGEVEPDVFLSPVAAVSVGMVDGVPLLDLCYSEDLRADVDVNVVINGEGKLIEVQGTAEGAPFSRDQFGTMLDLASLGIEKILAAQRDTLG